MTVNTLNDLRLTLIDEPHQLLVGDGKTLSIVPMRWAFIRIAKISSRYHKICMDHNLVVDINVVYVHGSRSIGICLLISSLIGILLPGLLPVKRFFLN